uniref:Regulatory protein zeste n=1 Tax=Steinernema glaseri TaxID=37863 RepID=A0A1I8AK65_9BILA
MSLTAVDIEKKHNENMNLARWIAERKEELFISSKDRVSDSIKEVAWKAVLKKCVDDGQAWTKGRDWAYLRDNKWVMVKSSVRRYLAGNGPSRQPQKAFIQELTNFVLEADILDPLKEKYGKLGGSITIKEETDITEQFRTPEIHATGQLMEEEAMCANPDANLHQFMTLSEALNAAQTMPLESAEESQDESLVELQKQALRAAIARDHALAEAAKEVQKFYHYQRKMKCELDNHHT